LAQASWSNHAKLLNYEAWKQSLKSCNGILHWKIMAIKRHKHATW